MKGVSSITGNNLMLAMDQGQRRGGASFFPAECNPLKRVTFYLTH